ncbi:MAG: hypothetical protein LR015_04460 [Verrucomicrobia bacterium]|nr:hypothetical protein [Verrucomicrobiota bacterium]
MITITFSVLAVSTCFFERWGFDPSSTLLIVDEAHNLPSRVAGHYSFSLHAQDLATWALQAENALLPHRLVILLEQASAWIQDLPLDETLDGLAALELQGFLQDIAASLGTLCAGGGRVLDA